MQNKMRYVTVPALIAAAFGSGMMATGARADQPYMHDALHELQIARASLTTAVPDKGGHRLRALSYVDRAIAEVRAGVSYERNQ